MFQKRDRYGSGAQLIQRAETHSNVFEFGGPRVYSYEHLLRSVAHQADLAPLLISIPFAVWHALAWASEILPAPLLTAIRWSSCRSTPWLRQTNLDLWDLEFHRTRSRQYSKDAIEAHIVEPDLALNG